MPIDDNGSWYCVSGQLNIIRPDWTSGVTRSQLPVLAWSRDSSRPIRAVWRSTVLISLLSCKRWSLVGIYPHAWSYHHRKWADQTTGVGNWHVNCRRSSLHHKLPCVDWRAGRRERHAERQVDDTQKRLSDGGVDPTIDQRQNDWQPHEWTVQHGTSY